MGWDFTGLGSIADLAKGILDRFWPPGMSETDKAKAQLEIQKMIEAREASVLDAQRGIIIAEMNQGDAFTKRARPTLVYAGLFFIFLVHVILPSFAFFTGKPIPLLSLPEEFWWAWGGVCSIWVVGRSFERGGATGKLINTITGQK